jgi:general secretion pathway protein G
MKSYRTSNRKGFTLVEILIVVIILGILAAIVIPQFTNASQDARKSSMTSQLQTLRSQVELFKLQHHDAYPTDTGKIDGAWDWAKLTTKTAPDEAAAASSAVDAVGPYLQQQTINPLVASADGATVTSVDADPAANSDAPAASGWVFSKATGKMFGIAPDPNDSSKLIVTAD